MYFTVTLIDRAVSSADMPIAKALTVLARKSSLTARMIQAATSRLSGRLPIDGRTSLIRGIP
jgi:hypothetical protein